MRGSGAPATAVFGAAAAGLGAPRDPQCSLRDRARARHAREVARLQAEAAAAARDHAEALARASEAGAAEVEVRLLFV